MMRLTVYRLFTKIVVELAATSPPEGAHARTDEPVMLARHVTDIWDEHVEEQIGQIVYDLLEAAPTYQCDLDHLLG